MATRVVYGNSHSSNGWPMVDQDSCEWITVPGTDVSLQIQQGQPLQILRAFAADWNAYVEPLRDADSACWTATNSVPTSNHLSGTACDYNWGSHPFRVADAGFDRAQIATMREMLDFYEGTVFWGNDWTDPKDSMHVQLSSLDNGGDIDTYNNPHTQNVIARKIRPDGFSTFRRGGTPGPALSSADRYALAVISEGRKRNISRKGICIALCTPFVESGWKMYANSNVPASLNFPHDAVGSDHDSTGLFQQRQAWGPLSCTMDAACSAGLFFDGGAAGQRGLTDFPYDTDARTPGGWAQAVQVSAFPDRYDQHWQAANQLYDRLAGFEEDDELANPEIERMIRELHGALFNPIQSACIYAPENDRTWQLHELLRNVDGMTADDRFETLAKAGEFVALGYVINAAGGRARNKDAWVIAQARKILAEIEKNTPEILTEYIAKRGRQ